MDEGYTNSAINPGFTMWDYGNGPWTEVDASSHYTATRWKKLDVGSPTYNIRRLDLPDTSLHPKWIRNRAGLLVDLKSLGSGDTLTIRQYIEFGYRMGRSAVSISGIVYGGMNRQFKVGFNGSYKQIRCHGVRELLSTQTSILRGKVSAATSSTITFPSSVGSTDYTNYWVEIVAGTGAGQWRKITSYNTGTRVATVGNLDWATTPSTDSTFRMNKHMTPTYFHYVDTVGDMASYLTCDMFHSDENTTLGFGTFHFAFIQLEFLDETALPSPFEFRSDALERTLAYRYVYPVYTGMTGFSTADSGIGDGKFVAGVVFPTPMRDTPTISERNSSSVTMSEGNPSVTRTATNPSTTLIGASSAGCRLEISGFSGSTDSFAILSSGGKYVFDADY